jgi:4'-phosphopantetheinyl transferase
MESSICPVITWILLAENGLPPGWLDPPGFLAEAEQAVYQGFRFDVRRREWALGRLAAKKLIQQARLQPAVGVVLEPVCIEPDWGETAEALRAIAVLPAADQGPRVQILAGSAWRELDGSLSISHSHGRAFCAFAPGCEAWTGRLFSGRLFSAGIGADIEKIEPRSAEYVQNYLHPQETLWLQQTARLQSGVMLKTLLWSIKEAALKSIRRGLALDPRAPVCLPELEALQAGGWHLARVAWDVHFTGGESFPDLAGWWRRLDDDILTIMGPI